LHHACYHSEHMPVVEFLIVFTQLPDPQNKQKPMLDINQIDKLGNTPLHLTNPPSSEVKEELAKPVQQLLLIAGADATANGPGYKPLLIGGVPLEIKLAALAEEQEGTPSSSMGNNQQ